METINNNNRENTTSEDTTVYTETPLLIGYPTTPLLEYAMPINIPEVVRQSSPDIVPVLKEAEKVISTFELESEQDSPEVMLKRKGKEKKYGLNDETKRRMEEFEKERSQTVTGNQPNNIGSGTFPENSFIGERERRELQAQLKILYDDYIPERFNDVQFICYGDLPYTTIKWWWFRDHPDCDKCATIGGLYHEALDVKFLNKSASERLKAAKRYYFQYMDFQDEYAKSKMNRKPQFCCGFRTTHNLRNMPPYRMLEPIYEVIDVTSQPKWIETFWFITDFKDNGNTYEGIKYENYYLHSHGVLVLKPYCAKGYEEYWLWPQDKDKMSRPYGLAVPTLNRVDSATYCSNTLGLEKPVFSREDFQHFPMVLDLDHVGFQWGQIPEMYLRHYASFVYSRDTITSYINNYSNMYGKDGELFLNTLITVCA